MNKHFKNDYNKINNGLIYNWDTNPIKTIQISNELKDG